MMWIIAKSTTIATTQHSYMFPPRQIYLCFFLQFWTLNFCKVVAIAIFVVLWELPTTSPLWWDQSSHHTVVSNITIQKKWFSSDIWNPGLSHFNVFFCIIMLFHWHSHILAMALEVKARCQASYMATHTSMLHPAHLADAATNHFQKLMLRQ